MKRLFALFMVGLLSACASAVPKAGPPNPGFQDCGSAICITTGAPGGSAPTGGIKFFIKGVVYSPTPIGGQPFDSPLKDSNAAIWSRDLPLMRAMGVNAIHVYNVTPPPFDSGPGPIINFLNAAWNGGDRPIYVIMSVFFTRGAVLSNTDATNAIANQYHDLDAKYASYPAVLGVTIGNELGMDSFNSTEWANFNKIARAAKQGFIDAGFPDSIVTTSEADGNIGAITAGEAHGAPVDVWGINIYRGRTFTNLFTQIKAATSKPVILTEWGAPASYHPASGSTYTFGSGPTALGACTQGSGTTSISDVAELPGSGNPNMAGLVDYVTNAEAQLYNTGYKDPGGTTASGGFFFMWQDEWWKGGDPNAHNGGGGSPPVVAFNGAFPGCYDDEGWFGLYSVARGTQGSPDILTARPTVSALQTLWAQEP
jgi:hypothetical protein